ncbi:Anaerobic dimethyl sulfoxide reductase chain A [Rubellimicrobium mesophilum DSM 19309]|uniref:Anaerobic dimethyl sulfoxide reductase chain A n=1 Tax=Rubellimicrobium mesophilum DSM 19309 TaxID=442562 RepID=A0A017HUJ6_9RHOB|nr:Anaerobic dimethyl sulfoxide reductase chain A [Rubellimicrobium mesophilum DSM 19309]
MTAPRFDAHPKPGDEVAKTTCYMCACRCGIDVHLTDGPDGTKQVAYIEGNRDHPVNKGVLCAKGSAGIMQVNSPARLRAPLLRTGPRGSGEFREITWDEALILAVSWLQPIRETAPEKLAFFTGRDQSQSFTGLWAQAFGTPNYAAHGGFCSVNMAAAGIYTLGGAFWEFGAPDWDRARLFLLFGVAEDHDSNPIKIGLGKLKARGTKVIAINPIRTGYNAVADDWLGITPGTDGLLVLSLIHCLLQAGKIDLDYLARFTNAPCLVNEDPASPQNGLLLRDAESRPLVIDRRTRKPAPWDGEGVEPDLSATYRHHGITHRPVLHHIAERYLAPTYAPENVAERTGIPAQRIRQLAAEIASAAFDGEPVVLDRPWTDFRGTRHATMPGRPVAMHAMRGISAHSNGFQTCRAIHLLQALIGAVETPRLHALRAPLPQAPLRTSEAPCQGHPRPPPRRPAPRLPPRPRGPLPQGGRHPRPHRQGLLVGGAALRPWPDAHGHRQRPRRRPVPDRHAVPLHGQHGLELVDEHDGHHGDAHRHRRERRLRHPPRHLRRRLRLRDGGLRRPRPPRHDLPRTQRRHQPPRPPDLRARRRRRRDPLAGHPARPRRAPLPVGAPRPRRAAPPPRLRRRRRQPPLPRLRRLPREPPAPPRHRAAGRLAHGPERPSGRAGRAQRRPTGRIHQERRLLDRPRPRGGRLLQALEPRLSGLGRPHRPLRRPPALHPQPLVRAPPPLPARRRGRGPPPAPRPPPGEAPRHDGPPPRLVRALRRRRE